MEEEVEEEVEQAIPSLLEKLRSPTSSTLARSSAAAEHVFSLLSSSFKEQQANSLEDYIETSIMLQYNYR